MTLIVSGLRVAAPRSWSSAAGQAIVSRRVSPGTDPAGHLSRVAGELIREAGWVDLGLGPDGSLPCAARLDVVLWSAGGDLPGDDDIGLWIGAVTRAADPLSLLGANWSREPLMPVADPWTCELTRGWQRWPGGWHEIERTSRVAITCTWSALSAVRVWFVASAAGYVDEAGGESMSGLLETDDRRPVRGALAQYGGYLAVERRHRVAGMLLSATADTASDPVRHAVEVANLRQAETNLDVTAVNVAASADRLGAWLGSRGTGGWAFLTADARELEASLATARGNAGRATAVQDRLQAMQAHADALRQQAETRANSYATLLLTVAAGAFAGAALPSQHRAAAAAAFGGALFVISLLVVDAARPYLRIHGMLAVIVLAGAGAAGAAALSLKWPLTLAGAAVGGAAGYGTFLLARALRRQPPWLLVTWLTKQPGTRRRLREAGQDPSAGSSA